MDGEAYALILRRLAALERRLSAVFRTGKVAEVQLNPYRVRADIGPDEDGAPVVTDFLPVMVPRSGEVRAWSSLNVGERVAVLSPGGEDVSAFVLPALISAEFDAASDEAGHVIERFSALGDAQTPVGRIEIVRGAGAADSAIVLAVGVSSLSMGGGGEITISNGMSSLTMNLTDLLLKSPHVGFND